MLRLSPRLRQSMGIDRLLTPPHREATLLVVRRLAQGQVIAGWKTNGAHVIQSLYSPRSTDAQSVDLSEPIDGLEFNFIMLGDTGACIVEMLLPDHVLVRKVLPEDPAELSRLLACPSPS